MASNGDDEQRSLWPVHFLHLICRTSVPFAELLADGMLGSESVLVCTNLAHACLFYICTSLCSCFFPALLTQSWFGSSLFVIGNDLSEANLGPMVACRCLAGQLGCFAFALIPIVLFNASCHRCLHWRCCISSSIKEAINYCNIWNEIPTAELIWKAVYMLVN